MRVASFVLLVGLSVPVQAQGPSLRVLTTELPPFFLTDNGEPAGIEFEIISYYAKANGLELDIQWVKHWPELFPSLDAGKGDLVAAACTITSERKKRYDFSAPHFPVRMQLVEREGSATTALSELEGSKLGVLRGSTGAEAFASVPNAALVSFPTVRELFAAVAEGDVRAIASESADAFLFLQEFQNLRMGLPLSEQQYYGFALPKESPHKVPLDENIARLKESGIYYRIVERYLGKRAVQHFRDTP